MCTPPAHPIVTYAGSLEQRKGVVELLEAAAIARRTVPGLIVRLAGAGSLQAELESRAGAPDLAGHVQFVGAIAHDDVPKFFQSGSVACVPSHGEPFGLVVLEAMAAGRPVIATDAGGPPHLLETPGGGRLVPVRDAPALATAIIDICGVRATDRVAMGEHNRRRVEDHFTWDHVTDLLERALRETVDAS